jgi:hypothetical protein
VPKKRRRLLGVGRAFPSRQIAPHRIRLPPDYFECAVGFFPSRLGGTTRGVQFVDGLIRRAQRRECRTAVCRR